MGKRIKIELIYFRDCPNWKEAKSLLLELKLNFKEVVQDE